jgi:type II secretory pathway component GspD/PulD (secretin)
LSTPSRPRFDVAARPNDGTRPARCIASAAGAARALGLSLVVGASLLAPAAAWGQEAEGQPAPPATQPEGTVEFSAFSEPVELMTLVDFIATELGINVTTKGEVTGQVMFNAAQEVARADLLDLLEALLAQYNYSLTYDKVGFYVITPSTDISRTFEGVYATTRIIPTPNIKPTSLKSVLDPTAGAGGQGSTRIAYVDDLGVIVVTDTPRNVKALEELIGRLLVEYRRTQFIRFDLKFVAAQAARERAVTLVGQGATLRGTGPGQDQSVQVPGQASSIDNLADRITIDPSGNALFFRGTEEEIDQVRFVIELIDAPTTLTPKEYKAGANAAMIADIASKRGLGEVIRLEDTQQQFQQFPFGNRGNQQQQQQQSTLGGGSVMMVDPVRGTILYYGTEQQQTQLAALIDALDVEMQEVVIERYPVKNIDATELAELLQAIIENESASESSLLPGARGGAVQTPGGGFQAFLQDLDSAAENAFAGSAENSFVTAHEPTNVVVVKAPAKLQAQFARLIAELDVRRPQVYLDVNILAVSNSRDFRLAVEGQLNAGQFSTQTNFGLGSVGEGGAYTDPKLPLPGLGGYSASLIKSQYVPVILNAIQTDTDARILSSPQLLVNDNQEASIESIEEQPTTTTTFGTNTDQTSFAGFEPAGTRLTVTPSISEAGYLRLQYEIELSNFTGSGSAGIPPPKFTRTVRSESVTIPTDATIVVGGITVDDTRNTVVKVPILGDIPIAGLLFRDTGKSTTEQVLYIFITPRILNDRNFADLRLLTRGPSRVAGLPADLPELEPTVIELISPALLPDDPDDRPTGAPTDAPEPLIIPLYERESDRGVVRRGTGGEGR